ncbi:RidA family protein [Defluviicoccus vanus]|uniref:RidA family protein n=1 Tax=Defluviicoccus vanus TaxID=111831 RepID=A0A7H1MZZ0_9PROT|nr:RidA family protein [Defluviicoccus vanus]QNT69026.1 RidA family protein [Defluviicoccus vanus]
MTKVIEARLRHLSIELPHPAPPAGAYVPYVLMGSLLFVSGQLPQWNGELRFLGRVGSELTIDDGYAAARLCGLNLLAQAQDACGGNLDRIARVVRLGGFVLASPAFTDHPKVINGASDLMQDVFGPPGRHARFAVGAPSLPLGAAVEVEGIFQLA